ncbi:MAG TPA: hypothetical protein VGO40_24490 [Longimicrobium sp.]|jgi:hypothetical protein|nr:hypothetical protein [Longimicrobium sp.]
MGGIHETPHLLTTALVATALAVAHAAAPTRAGANAAAHMWGLTTLGEYCFGTCGSQNICCKITIIAPPP